MQEENPSVSRKPGQHEEQERLLKQLVKGQAEQQKVLEALVKAVGEGKPIDVRFSWPFDNELMQIVREILELLKAKGGLTAEQEAEAAAKLAGGRTSLQQAVEENQP